VWRRSVHRVDLAASWRYAREQYAALVAERDALERELAAVRQQLREFQAVILERNRAYDNWHILRRERDIVRARHAERDPDTPLH
jgi:hypothetical protein